MYLQLKAVHILKCPRTRGRRSAEKTSWSSATSPTKFGTSPARGPSGSDKWATAVTAQVSACALENADSSRVLVSAHQAGRLTKPL